MITLTCTNCRRTLQIDDAFAGGVCRCKDCGTIQTVPTQSTAKASSTKINPPTKLPAPRAPVRDEEPNQSPANNLHDLAQIVASSGLSGSGLQSGQLRMPRQKLNFHSPYVLAGGAIFLFAAGVLVALLIMRSNNTTNTPARDQTQSAATGQSSNSTAGSAKSPPLEKTPNFMGVTLKGPTVVYLLDRGQGTIDTFDAIKAATIKSIASLSPGIKFQVIFWQTDAFLQIPDDNARDATDENKKTATDKINDVFAWGQSKIEPALDKALALSPAEMIILTGKNGLDDDFVKAVADRHKFNGPKIIAASVGELGSPDALKKIAEKTGGQYIEIIGQTLRDLTE